MVADADYLLRLLLHRLLSFLPRHLHLLDLCLASLHSMLRRQNDGIRLLQVQTHLLNQEINLCHSSCSLQSSGPLSTYLSTLSTWLLANPTEIVTLLITNPDTISPSTFGADFVSAGLDSLAYTPASTAISRDEWPTLGAMIDQGKRLVVFMDYNADFGAVPYIIDGTSSSLSALSRLTYPSAPTARILKRL
jgi:hypothetical protein